MRSRLPVRAVEIWRAFGICGGNFQDINGRSQIGSGIVSIANHRFPWIGADFPPFTQLTTSLCFRGEEQEAGVGQMT
jgi:hypothetical protein